jgi:hypothetical protein
MDTVVFDGIVREMGEVSTRRNFTRLLGGVVALGAGLALGGESLAKSKNHGKAHAQAKAKSAGRVAAQGKKKTITICFQNQTRTVKKKGYQAKFPGATPGPCPSGTGGAQQPAVCTTFVLSGGPNPSDPITIDDDGSILNVTTGKFLLIDNNGQASSHNAIVSPGKVGDLLRVRATDWGGCRSFSPLWMHCVETGQSKQVFSGDNGNGSCTNPKQADYLDITFPIAL